MTKHAWSLLPVLVVGIVLSGCSQNRQASQTQPQPKNRVAGTEEQARPATVNVTLTGTRMTASPTTIPAGDVRLNINNTSKTARTVSVSGPNNVRESSASIEAGKTGKLDLTNIRPGQYTLTSPATGGARELRTTVNAIKAETVSVTVNDKRVEFSPASVPVGQIYLNVTNAGNSAMSFSTSAGQGASAQRIVLQPKESRNVLVDVMPVTTSTKTTTRSKYGR